MRAQSQEAEEAYAHALDGHHRTATLHAFVANHVRHYRGNTHVESAHIRAAEVRLRRTSAPL